jgi:hypothetical protein
MYQNLLSNAVHWMISSYHGVSELLKYYFMQVLSLSSQNLLVIEDWMTNDLLEFEDGQARTNSILGKASKKSVEFEPYEPYGSPSRE